MDSFPEHFNQQYVLQQSRKAANELEAQKQSVAQTKAEMSLKQAREDFYNRMHGAINQGRSDTFVQLPDCLPSDYRRQFILEVLERFPTVRLQEKDDCNDFTMETISNITDFSKVHCVYVGSY
jgi:hypothetical protein